ncbi:MAG: hypothetical protein ACRCUP_06755 [Mycoplasmatales bacterium]
MIFFCKTKKNYNEQGDDSVLVKQIYEFLLKEGGDYFKINNTLIASDIPEFYDFVEKNEDKWEVGRVSRNTKEQCVLYDTEEEALMTFVINVLCTIGHSQKKLEYFYELIELKENLKFDFINKIAKLENLDQSDLQIINNSQLLYKNTRIIKKKQNTDIYRMYYMILFDIEWHKKYTKKLIEFGIAEEVIKKYFTVEKKIDKYLTI